MLKSKLEQFYQLVDEARQTVGDNAPRITDEVIGRAFPRTCREADLEGCEGLLREGVKGAVVKYIRRPVKDDRQRTFNDIAEDVMPFVEPLQSVAYYVPGEDGIGEYVGIPDLCHDLARLDAARKFMRLKGMETLAEADQLDRLYEYLIQRND